MKMFLRLAFLATSILSLGQANALIFSVDPASPVIDGNITPDDILAPGPTGPIVVKQGTALGLQDNFSGGVYDNLDALSKGRNQSPALL